VPQSADARLAREHKETRMKPFTPFIAAIAALALTACAAETDGDEPVEATTEALTPGGVAEACVQRQVANAGEGFFVYITNTCSYPVSVSIGYKAPGLFQKEQMSPCYSVKAHSGRTQLPPFDGVFYAHTRICR
jgi:hypothetical protein